MGNIIRNRLSRVDECVKPIDDLAFLNSSSRYLRKFVMIERDACRFCIENDNVSVEHTEVGSRRMLLQGGVSFNDVIRCSGSDKTHQLLGSISAIGVLHKYFLDIFRSSVTMLSKGSQLTSTFGVLYFASFDFHVN